VSALGRLLAFIVLFAAGMGSMVLGADYFPVNGHANPLFVVAGLVLVFLALAALGWPRGEK
jgi:sulfite exporter TauE/SafE